jgi:hypothetical protein
LAWAKINWREKEKKVLFNSHCSKIENDAVTKLEENMQCHILFKGAAAKVTSKVC